MSTEWRAKTFRLLSPTDDAGIKHRLFLAFLIFTIVLGALTAMASTLHHPDFARWAGLLAGMRIGVDLIFTLEYLLRLWTSPESDPTHSRRARRRYSLSFLGLIDLGVIIPFWLGLVLPIPLGCTVIVPLVALFKLARFVPGIGLFTSVIRNEGRFLLGALIVMLLLLTLASGIIYLTEHSIQPQVFSSIPQTLWWGIVTIASVGYGDMIPITPGGRLVAGVVMLLGIAVFAVPAGLLATGFAAELRKRDFIVTWQAVAHVPLFSGLDASRIASIARLLTPGIVPPDTVIVRRGDVAQAMFFIMQGEVEVHVLPRPIRLSAGQFFGEIGLLKDVERTATVISVSEVRLLTLDVTDFRRLIQDHPDIKEAITRVAETRLAGT